MFRRNHVVQAEPGYSARIEVKREPGVAPKYDYLPVVAWLIRKRGDGEPVVLVRDKIEKTGMGHEVVRRLGAVTKHDNIRFLGIVHPARRRDPEDQGEQVGGE